MLTQTNATTVRVIRLFGNTNIGVAVTLAPASHLEVSDPVVVRLQHFRVHEHFVSESVEADERNSAKQKELNISRDEKAVVRPDVGG